MLRRRWIGAIGVLISMAVFAPAALAQTLFDARQPAGASTLTIYSSLDLSAAEPLIDAFQQANPAVSVNYHELQTVDIYERVLNESDGGGTTADLVISSAMDLQMKLANDGYARRVPLAHVNQWPNWANWRDTAIALTYEPAVMVYHRPSFEAADMPRTRAALISFLDAEQDAFYGRIATYDIERAGVGFLFLARDAEHNRDIWELVRAMGRSGVKLYSNSSSILERVSDGRFAIGYNILGSYAAAWAARNPDLGIVLPTDYTIIMSRIALVPTAAQAPDLATRFLDFMMSPQGQNVMAAQAKLPALHPQLTGANTADALRAEAGDKLRPIAVSPALLVYLDQVRRARFIDRWNDTLSQR
ncbi:MAG: ABC transporter substrate-binding protein [Phyllobacteriaceae bacterium]|jgi:iron(III) transport system substrate-binding protein|nr:ABC transporter substrate-binding protein [Phyllobacteriaceae bacterium]